MIIFRRNDSLQESKLIAISINSLVDILKRPNKSIRLFSIKQHGHTLVEISKTAKLEAAISSGPAGEWVHNLRIGDAFVPIAFGRGDTDIGQIKSSYDPRIFPEHGIETLSLYQNNGVVFNIVFSF